jgi:hypothetical protein
MPLRDHFHPPLSKSDRWDIVHGAWPTMMVIDLDKRLPPGFRAGPNIHLGAEFEVDIAAYEEKPTESAYLAEDSEGGIATAVWTAPKATSTLDVDLENQDEYEVRIVNDSNRLVAAIEL